MKVTPLMVGTLAFRRSIKVVCWLKQLPILIASFCYLTVLAGCSAKQLYSSGQYMQRAQCMQLADQNDQTKCLSRSQLPYEDYQRQQEGQSQ